MRFERRWQETYCWHMIAVCRIPLATPGGRGIAATAALAADRKSACEISRWVLAPSRRAISSDNLVPQARLAAPEPIQVLNQNVQHIVLVLLRFSGGMRRDQHIAQAPER